MTTATKPVQTAPIKRCRWCGSTYQLIEDDGPIVCRPCAWASAIVTPADLPLSPPARQYDPHDR